eukprot:5448513-Amphidinium_carterae.1
MAIATQQMLDENASNRTNHKTCPMTLFLSCGLTHSMICRMKREPGTLSRLTQSNALKGAEPRIKKGKAPES